MNWKNKIWKYATALVVVFIMLNPEMIGLALFVDAIGLEIFLMLLAIQARSISGMILNSKFKPTLTYAKYFYSRYIPVPSCKHVTNMPKNLMLLVPGSATLMYILVSSVVMNIALNAYY